MTRNPPQLRRTGRSLPIALLRAREQVMAPIREMLAETGINEQKWRVLRVVDEIGPAEQTQISEAACLRLPSLTRILSTMERDGLIERDTDARDRRKTIVTLRPAGRELIARHAARSHEIMDRIEARIGPDRLAQLLDLLEDLARSEDRSSPTEPSRRS